MDIKDEMERLKGYLEELLSVEMLEYHNKNWLAGSNKTRSEERQVLIKLMMDLIGKLDVQNNRNR